MEENLKTKHIITIPEGCIAQIDGDKIIIKEKLQEFKDGDILICDYLGPYNLKIIMIYKGSRSKDRGYNCYVFRNHTGQIKTDSDCGDNYVVRLATEKEKQELFEYMCDEGLQWNAEEKKVEKIRWRAKYSDKYYTIDYYLNCVECITDYYTNGNNLDFNTYNYFKTQTNAEEALKRKQKLFKEYHEELGY